MIDKLFSTNSSFAFAPFFYQPFSVTQVLYSLFAQVFADPFVTFFFFSLHWERISTCSNKVGRLSLMTPPFFHGKGFNVRAFRTFR